MGERTKNMRKIDSVKIPTTPTKYNTGYAVESIHPNASLPA